MNDAGQPSGGLSFTEVSLELRSHLGDHWGAVWFVDGGTAYANESPGFAEDLLWASGLGLRYYTSYTPLRLDVAFPLDKRDGIDDGFQLYLSIGQAF